MTSGTPGRRRGLTVGPVPGARSARATLAVAILSLFGVVVPSSAGAASANPSATVQLYLHENVPVPSRIASEPCHNEVQCEALGLAAINYAHSLEHVTSMVLPRNWNSLSPTEQLFVVADLERLDRGLPAYLGLNPSLSAEALRAARRFGDPSPAPGFNVAVDSLGSMAIGGAWAGGGHNVLGADYGWMYDDGWGGSRGATPNIDCTSASAPACWGHRAELLGWDPRYNPGVGLLCSTCEMGTGYVAAGGGSAVDLVEEPVSTPPVMTFTWAKNVAPYLPKSYVASLLAPNIALGADMPADPLADPLVQPAAYPTYHSQVAGALKVIAGAGNVVRYSYETWPFATGGAASLAAAFSRGVPPGAPAALLTDVCQAAGGSATLAPVSGLRDASAVTCSTDSLVALAWSAKNLLLAVVSLNAGLSISALRASAVFDDARLNLVDPVF